MNNSKGFDIPILLIFFNRPETFEKVFEAVKKIKPLNLYLAQDGPRTNNPNDEKDILACRKIVENIDWECNVRYKYSDVNLGCGRGPESAISWAFETTDKLIILEDDCLPSNTFFEYCRELLIKYDKDSRVSYISGLNHFEEWNCGGNGYFFTKTGAIWGWATWRDEWQLNDYEMSNFNDYYIQKGLKYVIKDRFAYSDRLKAWEKAQLSRKNNDKLSYWDMQWGYVKYSQNKLVIVPQKNLITNVGIGEKSTHAQSIKKLIYRRGKSMVNIPNHELELPLKHPLTMICDEEYDNKQYKMARPSIICRIKILINKILKVR